MTTIFDAPEEFATTALAGFSSIYARNVRLVKGGVVRSTKVPKGKVAVVVGGGSATTRPLPAMLARAWRMRPWPVTSSPHLRLRQLPASAGWLTREAACCLASATMPATS